MKLSDLTFDEAKLRGIWWDYASGQPCAGGKPIDGRFCLLIKPHDDAFRAAMRDAIAPYVMAARKGNEPDGWADAHAGVWAQHVLLDWAGLEESQGVLIPYSLHMATRFMREDKFRTIKQFVERSADSEWAYLQEAEEQAKGN